MDIFQMISGVKTGTLDAKAEVLKMISGMNPAQRKRISSIIPQVEQVARQAGIDVGNFKDEVSAHLI